MIFPVLNSQIRDAIAQADKSVTGGRISELLDLNKAKDKQQYKLYRAEDAAFLFQRLDANETYETVSRIAEEYSMPCPEILWDKDKMRAGRDFNFLTQAHAKGILMTPRLIRNGMVAISPLMCGLAADFYYAARSWKTEPRIRKAYYRPADKTITFEADHAAKHFVIHEMTHAFAHHTSLHNRSPHHGPNFVHIYRDMLENFMKTEDEIEMLRAFDRNIDTYDLLGKRFMEEFPFLQTCELVAVSPIIKKSDLAWSI